MLRPVQVEHDDEITLSPDERTLLPAASFGSSLPSAADNSGTRETSSASRPTAFCIRLPDDDTAADTLDVTFVHPFMSPHVE
jgi:hypothetical protein